MTEQRPLERIMGMDGRWNPQWRRAGALLILAVAGCALAPSERYGQVSCGSAFQPDTTVPYHPGIICLALDTGPRTMGARSDGPPPPMKAISVDGRIFFVDARREGPPEHLR